METCSFNLTMFLLHMLSVLLVLYPSNEQHSPMLSNQPLRKALCLALKVTWNEIQPNSSTAQNLHSHRYNPNHSRYI